MYKLVAQKKITTQISVGIAVHRISSGTFLSISGGTSSSERLRYLIIKKKIVEKIKAVKKSVIPVRVKCSLSTPSATVEAAGGRIGIGAKKPATRLKHKFATRAPLMPAAPAMHNVRCEPAEKFRSR